MNWQRLAQLKAAPLTQSPFAVPPSSDACRQVAKLQRLSTSMPLTLTTTTANGLPAVSTKRIPSLIWVCATLTWLNSKPNAAGRTWPLLTMTRTLERLVRTFRSQKSQGSQELKLTLLSRLIYARDKATSLLLTSEFLMDSLSTRLLRLWANRNRTTYAVDTVLPPAIRCHSMQMDKWTKR